MSQPEEQLPLRPVLTLTEEELLVLTHDQLGVVPARIQLPQQPEQVNLVRAVAVRTLMARGLIRPTTAQGTTDTQTDTDPHPSLGSPAPTEIPWEATEPLGLTLSLREVAPVVLGLQRVLGPRVAEVSDPGDAQSSIAIRYLHLHPDVAVIEDVTPAGMHSFLTVFADRFAEAVADFIRPPEAVPGATGPHTLRTDSVRSLTDAERPAVAELLSCLGHPTVLVEAAMVWGLTSGASPAQPESLLLALGPGGSYRSRDSRTYHPVDPDRAIAELLAQALDGCQGPPAQGNGAGAAGPT